MITIINILLLGIMGFFILYLVLLSILALTAKKIISEEIDCLRRFAIIIPAYNESRTIARTIGSMQAINYPDELYKIIVIADNCTDNTAEIAMEKGAIVWRRNDQTQKGKGHALRWAFDKIMEDAQGLDAVVVVDADSIVSANLLDVMNKYRERGAEVIQGYLTVQPQPGIWSSEIIRVGFTLYNYVRPLGQRVLGLPTGLRGNGMCFSLEVLKKIPWQAYSQTEDLEYGMTLLLEEIKVVFAPEAIGYGIMPSNSTAAESQRERWEMGRYPLIRKYTLRLLMNAIKKHSIKLFDAFVNLVMPPLVNMMCFIVLMAISNFFLWEMGVVLTPVYVVLWLILAGFGLLHLLTGLMAAGADPSLYKALFYIPRYALWKIMIYIKILLLQGRTREWVRTSRE